MGEIILGGRMKAKYLVLGLPALALVLAGCKQQVAQTEEVQPEREMVSEAQEMSQAIKSGQPVICTMTGRDGAVMTYQFKGGKMRADGMALAQTGTTGSMINDLAYIYSWQQGESQGIKIAVTPETPEALPTGEVEPTSAVPQAPDFSDEETIDDYESQGFTVDCNEQTVDDSVFVPPAEVTFTDPGALMKGALNKIPTGLDRVGQEGLNPDVQQRLEQLQNQVPSEE